MELIAYAKDKGLRAVISTNGTMITEEKGKELKEFRTLLCWNKP